jgi:hypothetical protein
MNWIVIVSLVVLISLYLWRDQVTEKFLPVYAHLAGANDRLYKLLSSLKSVLVKNDVPFSLTGYVLLSAVEKRRLTRGQSQATVLIPRDFVDKLLSSTSDFVQLGLGLTDLRDGGYRITSAISIPSVTDTSILILPMHLAGDRWITNARFRGGYHEWYGSDELFPTKTYQLGWLDLPGPANPIPYLQRNYWSIGLNATDLPKRKWYHFLPSFYGANRDHGSIPGKTTVVLGSGQTAAIPKVGRTRIFPRLGRWRKFLWS